MAYEPHPSADAVPIMNDIQKELVTLNMPTSFLTKAFIHVSQAMTLPGCKNTLKTLNRLSLRNVLFPSTQRTSCLTDGIACWRIRKTQKAQ